MSFKIFSLQLLGKIKPVEVIEKQRKTVRDDYEEFQLVEKSDELKTYLDLENWVNSDELKRKKAEIEALQFKGSKEFNQLAEFEKLKKSKAIKKYFIAANSSELKRFDKLKDSEKLKEYDSLVEYIKEGQFAKDKKEIKSKVFKGSVEEKHWLDFKKLDKSAGIKAYKELYDSQKIKKHEEFGESEKLKKMVQLRNEPEKDKQKQKELKALQRDSEIKNYFKFEKSKKLKLYKETADSHDLKKYNELKAFIETDEFKKQETFLKDKKKFEKSEAYKKQSRFKQLLADADVKFYLKYEKSSIYKNYLNVKDSFDLKRYNELLEITGSPEFKEQKAYLEDKKKWQKTDEFEKEQQFLEMKKLPHLVKYFKNKDTVVFDFLKKWDIVFEDDFSSKQLDVQKWSYKTFLSEKLLGDNYSLAGDLQVYTNGENVSTGKQLTISVKKEKKTGKVWQMPAGFVPTELDFTSGNVSTWNNFWQEDGIFEAKIKFSPTKQLVSSFYLSGEQNTPRINLLEMGAKNRVGVSSIDKNGKLQVDGLDISNLKNAQWYIFTIEKQGGNFTWKINEKEVFSAQNQTMNSKLHLNASSIVINELSASQLPAKFEIDWVKCYSKK